MSKAVSDINRLLVRTRPPGRPIMYQSWGKLLFMHWPVTAESLRPLIPEPLVIDTFDGSAWIGITPFTMWDVRPVLTPPLPVLIRSHELNVRTYVHLDGVPGVWFFSLDANNPLAALGARLAFHLPYFTARMSLEQRGRTIYFTLGRTRLHAAPAEFEAAWTVGNKLAQPEPVSLDFSSSNATASTPLAGTAFIALGSFTDPGLCVGRTCSHAARRCSKHRGYPHPKVTRCCTNRTSHSG